MLRGDRQDILGGLILMVLGAYGVYGAYDFNIGTARQMGPGFFPMAISSLLVIFGLAIFLIALRAGNVPLPRPQLRPAIAVLSSILVFGLTLNPLGLIPSLFLVVIISALGDKGSRRWPTLLLALCMSIGCWLLFVRLLGLTMPVLRWPF